MANRYTTQPACTKESMRHLYEKRGMTQKEIAAVLNVSLHKVQSDMRRMGIQTRRPIPRNQVGEKNAVWKGDEAKYKALHRRVQVQRGNPIGCAHCLTKDPKKKYEWASLTKRYHDPMDYIRLCRSCHRTMDKSARNFLPSPSCPYFPV